MRWLPFHRDLGLQLLALYLLFVGPVIGAALVFDWLAGARLQHDVQAADLALARSIALETDASLQNALRTVAELARAPEVQALDTERLGPLFAAVAAAREDVDLIYVLDAQGRMRYHYPEGPGSTVGTDFSFRPYFQEALTAAGPLMSAGRISPTTGEAVATAVMPVRDAGGAFRGLVATNLSLHQFSATLAQIASDPTAGLRVSILDATGQIVADSDPTQILADARDGFAAEAQAGLQGQTGSRVGPDALGADWLRSYVPIASPGWAVVVHHPADHAFASPRAFHNGLLVAIGVFVVGGLFFWMMLSRRVIAPLERLAAFSAAISRRAVDPGHRAQLAEHSGRADQMGHLIRALTQMERDVERRFAELSTLLETSTAVVSTLDSQRVLEVILEQVQRLLAVDRCAIIALDERAGELRLRAARGLSDEYQRRIRNRSVTGRPIFPSVRAIQAGQIVHVPDVETEPGYPAALLERARSEGYRALTAVPLVTPHAPPSALLAYWRDPHIGSPEELNLIATFANQAAMAIENASLFALTDEQLRDQTRTLEALVQSLHDGLILESSDGRLLYCNRRIGELAGVDVGGEVPRERSVGVHQIHERAVVHGVLAGIGLVGHLPGVDAIGLDHGGDILRRAREADDVLVEARRVLADQLGRFAVGVERDEERRQPLRLVAELVERGGHHLQARGTDVGAMGVAEEDQHGTAGEVLVRHPPAGAVGQRERSADQGAPAGLRRRRSGPAARHREQQHRRQDAGGEADQQGQQQGADRFVGGPQQRVQRRALGQRMRAGGDEDPGEQPGHAPVQPAADAVVADGGGGGGHRACLSGVRVPVMLSPAGEARPSAVSSGCKGLWRMPKLRRKL